MTRSCTACVEDAADPTCQRVVPGYRPWDETCDLLFVYYGRHGHLPTKRSIYRGQALGAWLTKQGEKAETKRLDERQIARLQHLPEWTARRVAVVEARENRRTFTQNVADYADFIEREGRTPLVRGTKELNFLRRLAEAETGARKAEVVGLIAKEEATLAAHHEENRLARWASKTKDREASNDPNLSDEAKALVEQAIPDWKWRTPRRRR